jgi:hypothetical protein
MMVRRVCSGSDSFISGGEPGSKRNRMEKQTERMFDINLQMIFLFLEEVLTGKDGIELDTTDNVGKVNVEGNAVGDESLRDRRVDEGPWRS